MKHPIPPKGPAILNLHTPTVEASRTDPSSEVHTERVHPSDDPRELPPTASVRTGESAFPGIHAGTAQGLLSMRQADDLGRFVLNAPSQEERERRQIELFQKASVRLARTPSSGSAEFLEHSTRQVAFDPRLDSERGRSFLDSGIMRCGLFACPLTVTFDRSHGILNRLPLDHSVHKYVTRALEHALAMYSCTPLAYVRAESLIAVHELNSITPLQVQSALVREGMRLEGTFQKTAVDIPSELRCKEYNPYRRHQGNWSLNLAQLAELWGTVGPETPCSYLIIGYYGWDLRLASPIFSDPWEQGQQKLTSLLEGYLARDTASRVGEVGLRASPERTVVEVGRPMWIHEALTQAQAMQFKRMSQSASQTQGKFALHHEQRGSLFHWMASISRSDEGTKHCDPFQSICSEPVQEFEEPLPSAVEQIYDGFWRPARHVMDIHRQVAQTHKESP